MDKASIVIAEHGADWSAWAAKLQSANSQLVVLMQDEGEHAGDFLRRTQTRLEKLTLDGFEFKEAAFVGNGRSHSRSNKERSRIVRSLSSLLSRVGATSLYLDMSMETATRKSKQMLSALAWALNDLTKGSGLSVSVEQPSPCAAC